MNKGRVMIVEDEGLIALDLQQMLHRLGFEVSAVLASGEEAVEQVRKLPPDLILMDIHLHGVMDGICAAEAIHQFNPVPVIYLTGNTDRATVARAMLSGPYGFLGKPLNNRDLPAAIDKALLHRRLFPHSGAVVCDQHGHCSLA